MLSWRELCLSYASNKERFSPIVSLLGAFSTAEMTIYSTSFDTLLDEVECKVPQLVEQISSELQAEVDAEQANMFARRFESVQQILLDLSSSLPEAHLLLIGLVCTVCDLLHASHPRVLRVRAAIDFYYSHAAVLFHQQKNPSSLSWKEAVHHIQWSTLHSTVLHGRLEAMTLYGPVHIHLLKAWNVDIQTVDCRSVYKKDGFAQWVEECRAIAGVSGGFFLYSETDISKPSQRTDPVGLLVTEGHVQNPPVFNRASLVQYSSGAFCIEQRSMLNVSLSWGQHSVQIAQTNALEGIESEVVAFNRAWGTSLPLHICPSFSVVGTEIVESGVGVTDIPLAGSLVVLPTSWSQVLPLPGQRIQYTLPYMQGAPIQSAMAGGPMLVQNGIVQIDLKREDFDHTAPPVTFSQDETFDQNRLPRMAAGMTAKNELILAAIDGRHFHRAPGLTLHQTAELMQALGCVNAMNLDGGSSKRMAVQGHVCDLSTTEVMTSPSKIKSVRPVHSAILLHPQNI